MIIVSFLVEDPISGLGYFSRTWNLQVLLEASKDLDASISRVALPFLQREPVVVEVLVRIYWPRKGIECILPGPARYSGGPPSRVTALNSADIMTLQLACLPWR